MYRVCRAWTTLAAVVVPLFCLAVSAHATYTLVVGDNSAGYENAYPLGTGDGTGFYSEYNGEFQQVYSSSLFSGPITIDSIAFYSEPESDGVSTDGTYTDTFTLDLSSTSADPSNLSTTYADNVTSTETQVFDGTVSADLEGPGDPDFIIPITPFTYDPSTGNLLMDFNISNTDSDGTDPSGGNIFFQAQDPAVETMGTVYTFEDGDPEDTTTYANYGAPLITAFDVESPAVVTPEPSPIAALVVGLAMLGGLVVIKRKRVAASSTARKP